MFDPSSRGRLTERDLARFAGRTLFDRVARVVCRAQCLPRKELYEAWEVARRVRRLLRGGRVVDLAGGHGLLAQVMLLLDASSPEALVVDTVLPASRAALHAELCRAWPRLEHQVRFTQARLGDVRLLPDDVVVSSHACGHLTDAVLELAARVGARVAVLPCCHDARANDAGPLAGWVDAPLAIDIMRAVQLEQRGYRVWTQTIPSSITPKNRLLIAQPKSQQHTVSTRQSRT